MLISKRNKRGVIFLAGIVLVLIYAPRILANLTNDDQFRVSVEEIKSKESKLRSAQSQKENTRRSQKRGDRYQRPPEKFDPNQYTIADWQNLGLTKKQADVVLKFSKYGISSNESLKKIFVIPDELFDLIKDSTVYPIKESEPNIIKIEESRAKKVLNLNTASYDELIKLKGIGDFYAKKIIEHREKLGGYTKKEQLLELWKFSTEKLEAIEEDIVVSGNVEKISVNLASYEQLAEHPYISYKVANSIVKMREQRGGFTNIEELLESKLIDTELYQKLKPYIKL